VVGLVAGVLATGCLSPPEAEEVPPRRSVEAAGSPFTDVTEEAGIRFVHHSGASERRYLPETMGAGVAFFDYDGDDRPDLYFPDGRSIADPEGEPPSPALYRNLGDGRFEEVTAAAGLDLPFYGLGTAVGDADDDGDLDLFVSGLDGDRFFRNVSVETGAAETGASRFVDATAEAGLDARGFGSSAAFLDYDRDGRLDLFVGRYVTWSRSADVRCSPDGDHATYCTPEVYPPASNLLYRSLGDGRYAEVGRTAGVQRPWGKTLGVVPVDHDGDGWPDLAVANDTVRNFLFVNQGDGTFREEGVEVGLAFSFSGATRGAMGIDAGDLAGSGRPDLVIGNFSQEMSAVYRATGRGLYVDEAAQLGIGVPTLMTLAFGTLVFDYDLDGWLDVLFANGHIEPEIGRFQSLQSYAQPLHLFRNLGSEEGFEQVTLESGPLAEKWVGRGLATADYDGDGDLDVILTQNGRPARLLRNDSPPRSWLRVKLVGRASNRTGYGARVTAVAGDRRLVRTLNSGRSYLSASEPIVTFGLGDLQEVDRLEITWPSGTVQIVPDPPLRQLLEIEEPPS
jgi:hypothetical protein